MEYYIGIPEIIITERYDDIEGRSIRYDAVAAKRPSKCINPDCKHASQPYVHDHRPYRLLDVKSEGKIIIIELSISRYKCPDCGTVFPDEFNFFEKRSHL